MAIQKPPPLPMSTPPPLPGRKRQQTQEIGMDDMSEVVGLVEQARALLLQRIKNRGEYFGEPTPLHPEQLKLSVRIELGDIRQSEELIDIETHKKIEAMMDLELRKAGIRE